ncbi:MAG: tyrosine--tRNA ligase [Chloroflexi bacterium]|nr:tyrosine--tRNA ligase [Chloroflexota bacterium]
MSLPEQARLLRRGVAEIIVEEELVAELKSGKSLRLKMGFDPSAPDIHLGHVVGLRKLRQLQELGHIVVLIVADWTAQIGDPSGQSSTRPMLTREQVLANAQTYLDQFFRIVDRERTEIRWQSEWFAKFGLGDVIQLTSKFTVAQFLAREDFAKRFEKGTPISITELLYPLLQAYDSVAVRADVEFGGTDQKFNILVGRELQRMVGQKPQQVLLVPILVGTDGAHKMSKSLGNYIGVTEPPDEMYGKIMSLPDDIILNYFELLTDLEERELANIANSMSEHRLNPRDAKMRLGREIVSQFYSPVAAKEAEEEFKRVFQNRQMPTEMPTHVLDRSIHEGKPVPIADVMVDAGLAKSRSEAKRLIVQGAVSLDGQRLTEQQQALHVEEGTVLRVGRRRFVKLILGEK